MVYPNNKFKCSNCRRYPKETEDNISSNLILKLSGSSIRPTAIFKLQKPYFMSNLIHIVLYFEDSKGIEHTVNVSAYYYPAEPATLLDEPTNAYFEILTAYIKGVPFELDELADFLETKTAEQIEDLIIEKLFDTYEDFCDYSDPEQYLNY